tara:strand:+ start:152 stop:1216 length:1065 start_codon:yes stop_codon:yes gene_type:complete
MQNRTFGKTICVTCNTEFIRTSAPQIYCTLDCRKKDYRKIIIKECKNCRKKFEVVGNNHTYCSTKCKDAFYNSKYRSTKVFKETECVVCKKLFTPINYNNSICSDKCRKVKKSSSFRRKNRKNIKAKENIKFKEPKYENTKYSSIEDRAISILKNNGFTADQIGEVTGRKARSIRNRELEVALDKYQFSKDLKNDSVNIIKTLIKRLQGNTKLIESYSGNIIFNKLMQNNFKIYKGREGFEFDIVLEKDNKFFKTQLKTTRYYDNQNCFQITGTTFFHYDVHKKKYDYFKYKDIDYFIFTCIGVDKCYIIPFDTIKNAITKVSSSISFWPHRPHRHFNSILKTDNYLENFDIIK